MATYRNIQQLLTDLQARVNKLQAGNLTYEELTRLKSSAAELYERIAVIEFKVNERLLNSPGAETATTESEKVNLFKNKEEESGFRIIPSEEPVKKVAPVVKPAAEEKPVIEEKTIIQEKPVVVEEKQTIEFADEHKKETLVSSAVTSEKQPSPGSLAEKLKRSKIQDLKTAIPLNKKFLFMNTLFEGENTQYNQAIDKLNTVHGLEEARKYLRELSQHYGWDFEDADVISFTEYIERRHI